MSEDVAEKEIRRGARAAAMLGDPLFVEAFEKVERKFLMEWRAATSVEARERAHAAINALDDVALQLRSVISTGEIAAAKVNRANALREFDKRMRRERLPGDPAGE